MFYILKKNTRTARNNNRRLLCRKLFHNCGFTFLKVIWINHSYTVDTERVNVNLCEALLLLVGNVLCPKCSIADIEALLTCEAVDILRTTLSPCVVNKTSESKAKTTLVSDILTE